MKNYFETSRQLIDLSEISLAGRVLDIGGGGEGVISRHSGDRVVAIDKRADELSETPDVGLKIVMDACKLQFLDEYFDHITCFYTLMYMSDAQIEKFLSEANRVLKRGAPLWIWDAVISGAPKAEVFVAQLEVKISDSETVAVGYGVTWGREQSPAAIKSLCERAGFEVAGGSEGGEAFSLKLIKR